MSVPASDSDPRRRTGSAGERAAVDFYRRRGAVVLSRNFRCRLGELDLVVDEGGVVVFVEVKAASAPGGVAPELRVGRNKQRRIARLAEFYLAYKKLDGRPVRFDVIGVVAVAGSVEPKIVHYAGAFGAVR